MEQYMDFQYVHIHSYTLFFCRFRVYVLQNNGSSGETIQMELPSYQWNRRVRTVQRAQSILPVIFGIGGKRVCSSSEGFVFKQRQTSDVPSAENELYRGNLLINQNVPQIFCTILKQTKEDWKKNPVQLWQQYTFILTGLPCVFRYFLGSYKVFSGTLLMEYIRVAMNSSLHGRSKQADPLRMQEASSLYANIGPARRL